MERWTLHALRERLVGDVADVWVTVLSNVSIR